MIEAIIFDFDGVILDTDNIKVEAFKKIYKPYGNKIAENVGNYHLKHGGVSRYEKFKYFHKKYLNKSISEKDIKKLDKIFSEYVLKHLPKAKFVKGVKNFIKKNYSTYKMFISSGTPLKELKKTVKMIKMDDYFEQIKGSPQSKPQHILKIIDKYNIFAQNIVFIGDAPKDKQAAEKTNINFIARITKNSQLTNQQYKIKDFTEIEPVIEEINMSDLIC